MQYNDVITNSKWRTAASLKIALSPYLSRELSDFDQIWYTGANFHSEHGNHGYMHGSALRCVKSHSRSTWNMANCDPYVNSKRLKILRSRLGYIITLRSQVVMQNLTKIG